MLNTDDFTIIVPPVGAPFTANVGDDLSLELLNGLFPPTKTARLNALG